MRRLLALALLSLVFAACQPAESEAAPPEGWTAASETRWHRVGADTAGMFRDLSTLETMGATRDDSEFARWGQGKLVELYRTNPEVFDSVFQAVALPRLREGVPARADYEAESERVVEGLKRDFLAVYRQSIVNPDERPQRVYPDSLRQRGVGGTVRVQVYVDRDGTAQAVEAFESSGNATIDALALREAALTGYTYAWVTQGNRGARQIPNWLRIAKTFEP